MGRLSRHAYHANKWGLDNPGFNRWQGWRSSHMDQSRRIHQVHPVGRTKPYPSPKTILILLVLGLKDSPVWARQFLTSNQQPPTLSNSWGWLVIWDLKLVLKVSTQDWTHWIVAHYGHTLKCWDLEMGVATSWTWKVHANHKSGLQCHQIQLGEGTQSTIEESCGFLMGLFTFISHVNI